MHKTVRGLAMVRTNLTLKYLIFQFLQFSCDLVHAEWAFSYRKIRDNDTTDA